MSFEIHKQLLADTHYLGKLEVCHILLHKNAILPWFILVPEVTENDLLDISGGEREKIMDECAGISAWIKQHYGLSKTNFATIGNIVPQLHLHVVGRSESDTCWPKPVWGNLEDFREYTREEVDSIRQQLMGRYDFDEDDDPGC